MRSQNRISPQMHEAAGRWLDRALFALVVWVFAVACSGCMKPAAQPAPPKPRRPVIVTPPTDEKPQALTLKVQAESSLLATLREVIGDGGSVVLNPDQPIVVERDSMKLTLPPGTSMRYQLGDSGGAFEFSKPRPRVDAKVWGVRVSPELARLEVSPDNTGTAHVQSGLVKLKRRFSLDWLDDSKEPDSGTPPPPKTDRRPVMQMFVAEWCGICKVARPELDDAPFRIVEVPEPHPFKVRLPYFQWHDANGKRWGIKGWPGRAELIERWRLTPQKTSAAAGESSARYQRNAGSQWTFPGSNRTDLLAHLQDGQHAGRFPLSVLQQMSFAELLALHSDAHEDVVDWSRLGFARGPPPRTTPRRRTVF